MSCLLVPFGRVFLPIGRVCVRTVDFVGWIEDTPVRTNKQALNCPDRFFTRPEKKKQGETEMKKTYKIEVDCANCANLMEDTAGKVAGVASVTVNFMTQKMIVTFEEGQDPKAVMKEVLKACKKVEPDCEIEL